MDYQPSWRTSLEINWRQFVKFASKQRFFEQEATEKTEVEGPWSVVGLRSLRLLL